MIEIVLGWPPSDLSPNKRLHWAKLAAAKKQYRKDCCSVSKEQLKKYRGVYENVNISDTTANGLANFKKFFNTIEFQVKYNNNILGKNYYIF